MFGLKKRANEKSEHLEVYSGVNTIKQVKRGRAIVTFEFAPHPDVGKLVRTATIYITGLGVVILPTFVDGDLEKGIPKADYRAEADKVLKAAKLIVGLKYSPEMIAIAHELMGKDKTMDYIEAYINSLLRRSLATRSIVIQTCTGYNPGDLVRAMSPRMREEIRHGMAESATLAPPAQAPDKSQQEPIDRKKWN